MRFIQYRRCTKFLLNNVFICLRMHVEQWILKSQRLSVAWLTESQTWWVIEWPFPTVSGCTSSVKSFHLYLLHVLVFPEAGNHVWFDHLRGKSSAEVVWRAPLCKVSTDGIIVTFQENQNRQQGNPHVSIFQGAHLFLGCSIMMLDCRTLATLAEKVWKMWGEKVPEGNLLDGAVKQWTIMVFGQVIGWREVKLAELLKMLPLVLRLIEYDLTWYQDTHHIYPQDLRRTNRDQRLASARLRSSDLALEGGECSVELKDLMNPPKMSSFPAWCIDTLSKE